MTFYDYKVAPAPKQLKRVKGVRSTGELFAATLSEAINAAAREGWEYVRAESLPATEAGGLFRRGVEVTEAVLIFRRPRETLGPRLTAAAAPEAGAEAPRIGGAARETPAPLRRGADARLAEPTDAPTPLRAAPRLGPADQ